MSKNNFKALIERITLGVIVFLTLWQLGGTFLPFSPQMLELAQYDWLVTHRSNAKLDSRIAIVGLQDSDRRKWGESPPDNVLAEVLKQVSSANPELIGVLFSRDIPIGEGRSELEEVMGNTENLIGLDFARGTASEILPPEILLLKRRTAEGLVPIDDIDRKFRRIYLYSPVFTFPKSTDFSLNPEYNRGLPWELARRYLLKQGVEITEPTEKSRYIRLKYPSGRIIKISPLTTWKGNSNSIVSKFEVLINWLNGNQDIKGISFEQVLSGDFQDYLENKIVLVGLWISTSRYTYATPKQSHQFRLLMELFAIALSNLLNLEQQGFTQPIYGFWAYVWMVVWVSTSGWGINLSSGALSFSKNNNTQFIRDSFIITCLLILGIFVIVYSLFPSYWIPSAVTMLGMVINVIFCVIFVLQLFSVHQQLYHQKIRTEQQYQNDKKLILQQLEHEISLAEQHKVLAAEFEQKFLDAQEKLIAQERLAFLGGLVLPTHHKILNDVQGINLRLALLKDILEDGDELLVAQSGNFPTQEFWDYLQENWHDFYNYTNVSQELLKKIDEAIRRCFPDFRASLFNAEPEPIVQINLDAFLLDCYDKGIYRFRFNSPANFKVNLITNLSPLIILGKTVDLRYIFINLIENAYQALLDRFNQDNYQPQLELSCYEKDDGIYVIIQDNGIGVADDMVEAIFKPFVTTRGNHGTGLGLSIALDIMVVNYQGTIQLNQGDGYTQFLVKFPI